MGNIPPGLDEEEEEKRRDEIRLTKTRVALGEMDIVGERVWNGQAREPKDMAPPSQTPAHIPPTQAAPASPPATRPAAGKSVAASSSISEAKVVQLESVQERQEPRPTMAPAHREAQVPSPPRPPPAPKHDPANEAQRPALPTRLPSQQQGSPAKPNGHETDASQTTITSSNSSTTLASTATGSDISLRHDHGASSLPDAQPRRDISMSTVTYPTLRSLPRSPELNVHQSQHVHQQSRPPVGPRNVSMPAQPVLMGHTPRRSVSQIARDMERHAVNERQSTFEAHQSHRSFVTGCSLCSMDYDRM